MGSVDFEEWVREKFELREEFELLFDRASMLTWHGPTTL